MTRFNIGKYQVTDTLGSGAMGVVYKAYDPGIARDVAIKVLHEQYRQGAQGAELERRFKQEAQAAARCLHVNIVAIFDYGVGEQGAPYIVMEYVQGVELKRYLTGAQGDLSIGQSIAIMTQVLNALAYAHQHGVIHRDIKPSNIIITDESHVKVMDFGVAKLDTSDLTLSGYMVGTPSYMSPEGLRGQVADARSDLYATALVLLELLSGGKIKVGENIEHRVNALLSAKVPPHPIRDALAEMLIRALQANPEHRYQKAQDFQTALLQTMQAGTHTSDAERTAYTGTVVIQHSAATDAPSAPYATTGSGLRARAKASGAQLGNTAITLTPDLVSTIEKSLATHIGPLAKVLVKRGIRGADSLEHFTHGLAAHIPNDDERNDFLAKLKRSGIDNIRATTTSTGHHEPKGNPANSTPTDTLAGPRASEPPNSQAGSGSRRTPYPFTDEDLKLISDHLAFFLGPMAPRLVKSLARKSTSPRELQQKLAETIPCAKERQAFLAEDPLEC